MTRLPGSAFACLGLLAAVAGVFAGCRIDPVPEQYLLNDIPALVVGAPKNVILVVGDGMGSEHIRAGGFFVHGTEGSLTFEDPAAFPVSVDMGTRNVWGGTTDSAASATAMATGRKVSNRTLSLRIPGGGESLDTLAEAARAAGKAVGLVTTDNVCSATPAAFVAHHDDRYEYGAVAPQILSFTPEILFGGGLAISAQDGIDAGYAVVGDATGLEELASDSTSPAYGRFGDDIMPYVDSRGDLPTLSAMAIKALDRLEEDPDGFFLVVENELIDESSHCNDEALMVKEVAALDEAVAAILAWMGSRTDTLVVVTADHETGGLEVLSGRAADEIPDVSWSTGGHTSRKVKLFAAGPDSGSFELLLENVDVYRIMIRYFP